mgnify:CR=1 FL=1
MSRPPAVDLRCVGCLLLVAFVLVGANNPGYSYMLLLAGGAWFAYRARKAPIEFNESTQVLACIAFLGGFGVLLIPLFFMIKEVRASVWCGWVRACVRACGWVGGCAVNTPLLLLMTVGLACC